MKGVIHLLAVVQPTKDKVRPVMDIRELNAFVESHTGDEQTAVCVEKVPKWRPSSSLTILAGCTVESS